MRTEKYIKKALINDVALRLAASLLTTLVNKVLLLPVLAHLLSIDEYGSALTIIGLESLLSIAFANSLYSVRLIMNSEYNEKCLTGDFKRLLYYGIGISVVIFSLICSSQKITSTFNIILLIPYIMLAMSNMYYTVWYPITLDFKMALYQSIFTAIGSVIGLLLVYFTACWPLIYLCSAIFGAIFLRLNTGLIKEPIKKTALYHKTRGKWFILIVSTVLSNGLTYLDRFILYPIIGAASVAVYITASYFGKSISILVTPLSNVMLGYFAQSDFRMTKNKLLAIIGASLTILFLFTFIIIVLGEFVTGLLFPSIIADAKPYIVIANLASATAVVTQMVQAVSLKYTATKWQLIIQSIYALIYIGMGLTLVIRAGILGLCISVLISNFIRFAALMMISIKAISEPHLD